MPYDDTKIGSLIRAVGEIEGDGDRDTAMPLKRVVSEDAKEASGRDDAVARRC